MTTRTKIEDMDLSLGKETRLRRMFYEHGPGEGKALFLPIDQGLEHGPVDFLGNPECENPDYELRLALDGGYSAIVFQVGIAQKYMRKYAGYVPLVLKLNGKTSIPSDDEAFSPLIASVEDAVRMGADAVGYTLYVGSPAQDRDFLQFKSVREDAERYGMPVIVWSYPRGRAVEAKGGKESLWAVDYATRVAAELGADVIKVNFPKVDKEPNLAMPPAYRALNLNLEEATEKVVRSAGKSLVVFSGGAKISDEEVLQRAEMALKVGAAGLIFGRNTWQRCYEDAMGINKKIKEVFARY
jgi:fructose-bisphosphate aldolase, class I